MRLKNKVAIVTGGGNGIGSSICKAFSEQGAHLMVADIDLAGAKGVAGSLTNGKQSASAVEVDVADSDSSQQMADATLAEHGRIDILVNNAGARIIKGLMQHTQDDWNRMIQINLTGPFLCAQAVIPHMVKQGSGNIICSPSAFMRQIGLIEQESVSGSS